MGLLTAPISLARTPLRLTLRIWEFGLSSATEAARLGMELLGRDRPASDFSAHRAPSHPEYGGNGGPPDPDNPWRETPRAGAGVETAPPAEPEIVVPETGMLAPEPGEAGPEPDVLEVRDVARAPAPADAPPAVPDELIPDHVDEEPVLVAETAEAGAEGGAGPELHVDPPWDGYDRMTAADIRGRLAAATATEAAAVLLYETTGKSRRSVLDAAERAQRR